MMVLVFFDGTIYLTIILRIFFLRYQFPKNQMLYSTIIVKLRGDGKITNKKSNSTGSFLSPCSSIFDNRRMARDAIRLQDISFY
jgi:hypothetical protein